MRYLVFLLLASCSMLMPKLYTPIPDEIYKHDLRLVINAQEIQGVGVVPRAAEYMVTVYPEGKIDRIQWRTCNQEQTIDKPLSGWFSNKFEFILRPTPGFEDETSCALTITVLEEKSGAMGLP